ncbi:MAG TPA: hypothetical protein VN622_08660 [Clostridia bacterium]|nr:hypothetical protein [Clostridia bacterium]
MSAAAQETPKLTLDTNPTLFAVLAGMHACGYDQDLANSIPLRGEVRDEVLQAARTPRAQDALDRMCRYYVDHQQGDNSRQLAQYISLAINLGAPPAFEPKVREADMAPDAVYVLGFVPLLANFYETAGLEKIWARHGRDYESLIERFHKPVANLLMTTDLYLKQPLSGYVGRGFSIYLEPMAPAGLANARNYGQDYYMVVSPVASATGPALKLEQIRHTYLHYILDPLTQKRANTMARLQPLLEAVVTAPLSETYKRDVDLLVTESLIRAIEARMAGPKMPESARQAMVDASMGEGFILTRYFYDALITFEKEPVGLRDVFGDWLHFIDVNKEVKRAAAVQFAASSSPEIVRPQREEQLLDAAEKQLAARNFAVAQKLAQQALDENRGDAGRALFVLARAATLRGDVQSARTYFERTLRASHEPRVTAWSHIYLGRISDLQEDRQAALEHYRAALEAGDTAAETKTAAERGLQQPYNPVPQQPKP